MRLLINSAMTVQYPENFVFSGDLNRVSITKTTTATYAELSFIIDGYTYKENLYFLTTTIDFSLSETLKLLFDYSFNTTFSTVENFSFTIKIYNNLTLIDTETFSIATVILGKRRVFDKLGVMPNILTADFDPALNIYFIYYNFTSLSNVYIKLMSGSAVLVGQFNNYQIFNLNTLTTTYGAIDYLYYHQSNLMLNPTFQYLGGANFWTNEQFTACGTFFKIDSVLNLLRFTINDSSCGNNLTTTYYGGTFIPGKSYKCTIEIDEVENPSSADQYVQLNLGGTLSSRFVGTGTFTETLVCGTGTDLKIKGSFDILASTLDHFFSAILIDVHEPLETNIYLNRECAGVGKKLGLRFKNRFGFWRFYYVIKKSDGISSSNGISLWFLEDNISELNSTYAEQNKNYSQSVTVFRESLTNEQANDFSDIVYSDNVHIYDEVNSIWMPIKVSTNSFNIVDKETLFDVSLNLLLQSTNG